MAVTVILPEHFIRGSLGPVLEKQRSNLRRGRGKNRIFPGWRASISSGLQLLISLSKGLGKAVPLFPAEKAERLRNMMNFIGMPASEYFTIGGSDD